MAKGRKVIITCAVTGSIHTPSMSPHLPLTPADIAQQSIDAAEAGAARHLRDERSAEIDRELLGGRPGAHSIASGLGTGFSFFITGAINWR